MEEGTFMGWLKRSGDIIEVGDPLFELEGEKASQEIESVDRGILYIPTGRPRVESWSPSVDCSDTCWHMASLHLPTIRPRPMKALPRM